MRRKHGTFVWLSFVLLLSCFGLNSCENSGSTAVASPDSTARELDVLAFRPEPKKGDTPYEVAVISSGDYYFYSWVFRSMYEGLAWHGWVPVLTWDQAVLDDLDAAIRLTNEKNTSAYLTFPTDLYLDLGFSTDFEASKAKILSIIDKKRADALLVLGTDAGILVSQLLKDKKINIPVMVESVSDPLAAGITATETDSGQDLLSVSIDPGYFARQIEVFHRATSFSKLGVLYVDTAEGRSYVGLEDIQQVAQNRNFELVPYTDVLENIGDEEGLLKAREAYLKGVEILSKEVDAILLGLNPGFDEEILPRIVEITRKNRIASYSNESTDSARYGILMSLYEAADEAAGRFAAEKMIRIFKGATPRSLTQVYQGELMFEINLAFAREIGVIIPMDIMLSVEKVYDRVEPIE